MSEKRLMLVALFFIILFPVSILTEKRANYTETRKTAFINPSQQNNINCFEISAADKKMSFSKNKNNWTFSDGINIFPCDNKTADNFLKVLSKIRKLEKISRKNLLDDNNFSYKISYYLNDEKTEFLTGKKDLTLTRRQVQIPGMRGVFITENDFDSFLTSDENFWINRKLLKLDIISEKTELNKISLLKKSKRNTLINDSSSGFEQKAQKLLSLNHGKISRNNFDKNKSFVELSVETSEGLSASIKIQKNAGDEDYTVLYETEAYNYEAELSAWTYEKIRELFSRQ